MVEKRPRIGNGAKFTDRRKLDKQLAAVSASAAELLWRPKDEHRKCKAEFWTKNREANLCDAKSITAAHITRLTGEKRAKTWWAKDEFQRWFKDERTVETRFEYLMDLWLDNVGCIIVSDDPKAFNAKIALGKFLADMTYRTPPTRKETKVLDSTIPTDKKELDAYIAQQEKLA